MVILLVITGKSCCNKTIIHFRRPEMIYQDWSLLFIELSSLSNPLCSRKIFIHTYKKHTDKILVKRRLGRMLSFLITFSNHVFFSKGKHLQHSSLVTNHHAYNASDCGIPANAGSDDVSGLSRYCCRCRSRTRLLYLRWSHRRQRTREVFVPSKPNYWNACDGSQRHEPSRLHTLWKWRIPQTQHFGS